MGKKRIKMKIRQERRERELERVRAFEPTFLN